MMSDLDVLAKFVEENFPNDANMPNLQVVAAASSVACPVGKVLLAKHGNDSNQESTVCGKHGLIRVDRIRVGWGGSR